MKVILYPKAGQASVQIEFHIHDVYLSSETHRLWNLAEISLKKRETSKALGYITELAKILESRGEK